MTQDSVFSVEATEKNKKDQTREDCAVEVLQPNKKSIALLDSIYAFVVEEENRPVRYYDEQTQQEIQSLCPEIDIDILHMTEAMRLQLAGEPEQHVTVDMKLNVNMSLISWWVLCSETLRRTWNIFGILTVLWCLRLV